MAKVFLDITPLRVNRDFRFVWTGQVVNQLGSQLTLLALNAQLYALTKSKLALGLLGAAQLVPLVVCSIVGGTIADTYDRRKILLVMQILMAITSAGLALNGHSVWPIFVIAAIQSGLLGVDWPTRSATTATIVGPDLRVAAFALNSVVFNSAQVFGPLLGGLLVKASGPRLAYVVDVASYLWAFTFTSLVRPMPPSGKPAGVSIAAIADGFRYLRTQRLLQSTFVADLNAMVFGMPRALFAPMAYEVFKGGAGTLGVLTAAPAVGALVGGFLTGWVSRIVRQGRAVIVCIVIWGVAITGFGFSKVLWLGVVFLGIAGAADMVSAVFRNAISQETATDEMRGRMSSIFIAVVRGGPLVGDYEAGQVAALTSTQVSVVSGGLLCVGFRALIAWLYPELRRYRIGDLARPATVDDPDSAPARADQ